jgi:hypothetical protein
MLLSGCTSHHCLLPAVGRYDWLLPQCACLLTGLTISSLRLLAAALLAAWYLHLQLQDT